MGSNKESNKKGLAAQIERIATSNGPVDSIDPDLLSHIRYFFSKPVPTIENFSLETTEQAQEALAVFEATKEMLDEKLKTLKALKKLATEAQEEEN
jgi:hypothetical protein